MLVLTRQEGESVRVGDDVVVTVVRISGNRVQIGVVAENQPILRDELQNDRLDEIEIERPVKIARSRASMPDFKTSAVGNDSYRKKFA